MGRTVTQGRRRPRLRHRPQLECLDDRCLLSTGLAPKMIHHGIVEIHDRPAAWVRLGHTDAAHGRGGRPRPGGYAAVVRAREHPAGTAAAGASASFDPIIGAAQARTVNGVDGTGMAVAVIDTGVDYKNAALGGAFGPGAKVVAGFDFADNSGDPLATTSQHGTAVAGLIGSDDPTDLGVAPGVKIVALRVTDQSNTASLSSIASALQWVIDHHAQYNITAVNISLSDGNNYAHNWFAQGGGPAQQITDLIGQLQALNIPVVAATGNSFDGKDQGEGFPAVVPGTISVTATDLSDHLLANAQRLGPAIGGSSATTLAAPGEGFAAPSGDSGTTSVDGTSFAAPLVTGAVILLQQIYQSRFGTLPTVDQLKSWLEQGSDPVSDPATGITIGRLDIPKAAGLVPQVAPQPAAITSTAQATLAPAAAPVVSTPMAAALAPVSQATTKVSVSSGSQAHAPKGPGANARAGAAAAPAPVSEELLKAMSIWAAANGTGGWLAGVAHVHVWNA